MSSFLREQFAIETKRPLFSTIKRLIKSNHHSRVLDILTQCDDFFAAQIAKNMPYFLTKVSSIPGNSRIHEYVVLSVEKLHLNPNRVDEYSGGYATVVNGLTFMESGFVLHNLVKRSSTKSDMAIDYLISSRLVNCDIEIVIRSTKCTALQLAMYRNNWSAAILLGTSDIDYTVLTNITSAHATTPKVLKLRHLDHGGFLKCFMVLLALDFSLIFNRVDDHDRKKHAKELNQLAQFINSCQSELNPVPSLQVLAVNAIKFNCYRKFRASIGDEFSASVASTGHDPICIIIE